MNTDWGFNSQYKITLGYNDLNTKNPDFVAISIGLDGMLSYSVFHLVFMCFSLVINSFGKLKTRKDRK